MFIFLRSFRLISLFTLFLLSGTLTAQWVQTNGPYGGDIRCTATGGSYVFIGSNGGGVFRSSDAGQTWSQINTGLSVRKVYALYYSGQYLFAGTEKGLFRSADNGDNWSKIVNSLNYSLISELTAISARAGSSTLFAAAADSGICRSSDNGQTWQRVNNGLPTTAINCLSSNGASILLAGTASSGIYYSTNLGNNWIKSATTFTGSVLGIAANAQAIYAAASSGLYRSTDNGVNWVKTGTGLPSFLVSVAANGSALFAGSYSQGIFRSTDNGENFIAVNTGFTEKYVAGIETGAGSSVVLASTMDGIYRSNDNGLTWVKSNQGIINTFINALAALKMSDIQTDLYAASYGSGAFRSTDNGNSWIDINNGLTDKRLTSFAIKGQYLFAGSDGSGIFRSTDYGQSWTAVNSGLVTKEVLALAAIGGDIFAGTYGGPVFRSSDDGNSWVKTSTGIYSAFAMAFAATDNYLFAGTYNGIFRSSDRGNSWSEVNTGLTNLYVPAFAVQLTGLSSPVIFAGCDDGIFVSTNNGNNWMGLMDVGLPYPCRVNTLAMSGNQVFTGLAEGGIYHSSNGGLKWKAINTGLPDDYIFCITSGGENLVAGTESGVWRRLLSEVPVELSSFTAAVNGNSVALEWTTATEKNNMGFHVERKTGDKWEEAAFVQGHGTTTELKRYLWTDKSFEKGFSGKVLYRLKQTDYDGTFKYSNEVEVTLGSIPAVFSLSQNYPNPFNPETKISYSLPVKSDVIIKVYNSLGKEVATLVSEEKPAGNYDLTFNAEGLSSGVYICRMQAGSYLETRKMTVLK